MRIFSLVLLILFAPFAQGQISEMLVTSRSVVLMDLSLAKEGDYLIRGDWEDKAGKVQKYLALMGVDAIAYLHADDWNASPVSKSTFQAFFQKRHAMQLFIFSQNEYNIYELAIKKIDDLSNQWKTTGTSLNQVLFQLGREIKQKGFVVENFLFSDSPEIVTDVSFSKWTASTTFPGQIKRLKIGVGTFENEDENRRLQVLMSNYPFEYDLIEYSDDEDAFRQGYQFVLVHLGTAGGAIKKLLNYKASINETYYTSTVVADSTTTKLKAIPVDAFVHKFYFRQTVNHEAFVGKLWDADVTWEKSLENFILNIRMAFKEI